MARSRVGGSSGLLSGKLGDVIFNITRNADGSFRQVITPNPDGRFNPNTDEQARARMTMAMIERAMFTYRDFMGTGFEGVDPGTNSVSKFSELNYNEVKQEILDYWNEPDWTEWNYDFPRKGQSIPKDGMFIISQGSLKWEGYIFCQPATPAQRFFEVECRGLGANPTVRQWLARYNLKQGMQFVGIFFCMGTTPSRSFVAWIMLYTEPTVRLDDVLTASNWRNYIKTNSNVPLNSYFTNTDGSLHLRCERLEDLQISRTGCTGRRIRMRDGNVFRYNNCQMQWVAFPSPQEAWGWKTLWDVKPSWTDSPVPPPVPPTPPRVPSVYQEVEWVQRLSGEGLFIADFYRPRYCKFSMRTSGVFSERNYFFLSFSSSWSIYADINSVNNGQRLYMRARGNSSQTVNVSWALNNTIFDATIQFLSTDFGYRCTYNGDSKDISLDVSGSDNPKRSISFWYANNFYNTNKIYEVICHDVRDDSLMFDFIPCYRKSDGFCGFYDTVSQMFYTAQEESGQYSHGPEINT